MLTLELERDTALVPPEFGVDAIGITEAVEAEMPDGPRGPAAAGAAPFAAIRRRCCRVRDAVDKGSCKVCGSLPSRDQS